MRILKRTLLILLAAFLILQAFRPEKNSGGDKSQSIALQYPVPANVEQVLQKACYDCHSNKTNYPWYAEVQPVAWWIADHVKDGKRHMNFDAFGGYRPAKQYHKLEECIDEVKDGAMPMESYQFQHKEAKLTEEEKTLITSWFAAVRDTMKARYPADSLVMKKK